MIGRPLASDVAIFEGRLAPALIRRWSTMCASAEQEAPDRPTIDGITTRRSALLGQVAAPRQPRFPHRRTTRHVAVHAPPQTMSRNPGCSRGSPLEESRRTSDPVRRNGLDPVNGRPIMDRLDLRQIHAYVCEVYTESGLQTTIFSAERTADPSNLFPAESPHPPLDHCLRLAPQKGRDPVPRGQGACRAPTRGRGVIAATSVGTTHTMTSARRAARIAFGSANVEIRQLVQRLVHDECSGRALSHERRTHTPRRDSVREKTVCSLHRCYVPDSWEPP